MATAGNLAMHADRPGAASALARFARATAAVTAGEPAAGSPYASTALFAHLFVTPGGAAKSLCGLPASWACHPREGLSIQRTLLHLLLRRNG